MTCYLVRVCGRVQARKRAHSLYQILTATGLAVLAFTLSVVWALGLFYLLSALMPGAYRRDSGDSGEGPSQRE